MCLCMSIRYPEATVFPNEAHITPSSHPDEEQDIDAHDAHVYDYPAFQVSIHEVTQCPAYRAMHHINTTAQTQAAPADSTNR